MAKGRPRSFDLDHALEKALHLFWAHGYEGASISMLASEMGINVPSLYAAFGNKEALFLKAVEKYGQQNGPPLYAEAFKKKTSYEVARFILEGEVELVTRPGTPDGCLVMHGALVTSPESDPIQKYMSGLRAMAEGWIEDKFHEFQKSGDLPESADPKALACYIMTMNSGLALQAKSGIKREQLMKVVDVALAGWPTAQ
jgi:AcrR family transcriptional regulator